MSCHSFTPLSLKPPINQENSNDKNKSSRDRNFFKQTRKMHHWINENHIKPWISEFILTPHLPTTQKKKNFVRIHSNTQVELIFQHDTIPNPEKSTCFNKPPTCIHHFRRKKDPPWYPIQNRMLLMSLTMNNYSGINWAKQSETPNCNPIKNQRNPKKAENF